MAKQDISKLDNATVLAQAKKPAPKTVTTQVQTPAFDTPGCRYSFYKADAASGDNAGKWFCTPILPGVSSRNIKASDVGIDDAELDVIAARIHAGATS